MFIGLSVFLKLNFLEIISINKKVTKDVTEKIILKIIYSPPFPKFNNCFKKMLKFEICFPILVRK